jgi:hypothetical protein
MSFIGRWAASTVALGFLLVLVNEYHFFPRDCNDCGIVWGFPLPFERTETFGTSPHTLWRGVIADLTIVLIAALVAAVAWSVVVRRNRPNPEMNGAIKNLRRSYAPWILVDILVYTLAAKERLAAIVGIAALTALSLLILFFVLDYRLIRSKPRSPGKARLRIAIWATLLTGFLYFLYLILSHWQP